MDPQIVDIDVWKVKGNFWLNWHDNNEEDWKWVKNKSFRIPFLKENTFNTGKKSLSALN